MRNESLQIQLFLGRAGQNPQSLPLRRGPGKLPSPREVSLPNSMGPRNPKLAVFAGTDSRRVSRQAKPKAAPFFTKCHPAQRAGNYSSADFGFHVSDVPTAPTRLVADNGTDR